jgi:hypothetical protein
MYSYLFFSKYFNKNIVKKLFLTNNNWKEANINSKFVNFIFWDNYVEIKRLGIDNIETDLKVFFHDTESDKKKLTNKSLLYENMLLYDKKFTYKYFMKQYDILKIDINLLKNIFDDGRIWILKPTFGFSGSGIKILKNYEELKIFYNKNRLEFNKMNKKNLHLNYTSSDKTWIISEYITNTLLFLKKKFHFRVFIIITKINNIIEGYLFNIIPIVIAKKDYIKNNFTNKNIYNTHWQENRAKQYVFPIDFYNEFGLEKTELIHKQIKIICDKFFYVLKNNIKLKCYSETKNCFEIFGIDLMVNDNFDVKIIEFNEKPGFGSVTDFPYFSYLFLQVLFDTTINKLYNEKYHIKVKDNLILKLK